MKKALVITGPQGSGKTNLAKAIAETIGSGNVVYSTQGVGFQTTGENFDTIIFDGEVNVADFELLANSRFVYMKDKSESEIELVRFSPTVIICTQRRVVPPSEYYNVIKVGK